MSAPRLEVDLGAIEHNAASLVGRLAPLGIGVTGVTKALLGAPRVAAAMVRGGASGLGDSRIEDIEAMRRAGLTCRMTLIRSPMPSQVDRVVASADVSLDTEIDVVAALSGAAVRQRRTHHVVLMVELGDLREGILPRDLLDVARRTRDLPGLVLDGIGANLACQSGVAPDTRNMAELSALASSIESSLGCAFTTVSGGNSANLGWALARGPRVEDRGRVDDLRLGEAILLGCNPLDRRPIDGLRTDAFRLVAEVIEAKDKPSAPWGALGETAFGRVEAGDDAHPDAHHDAGLRRRVIVALGRQDTEPGSLVPPPGMTVLGSSSDHLVLDPGGARLGVGDEVAFGVGYAALVRAAAAPFVTTTFARPRASRGGQISASGMRSLSSG